jgi:argininosuccinate lyase
MNQQKPHQRDEFFWLSQTNKASAVINADEGLLEASLVPNVAAAVAKVIEDAEKPGGKRPGTVITYEPLLIEAGGQEVTMLHAGRSSQDMHATYYAAIMRDNLLQLSRALQAVTESLLSLAENNTETVVPNYTNGVAAQPNSYAHYLLGFAAGFERDAQRIREAYGRLDRCPMGTTVLNGTSWPLNRERMAAYLGFSAIVDNAYDASQITPVEYPAEIGAVVTSIALHVGCFIEDLMTQYAQPRPWIVLQEGGDNTYVSSAMPQKRNPGILNNTRRDASTAISLAMGTILRAHNLPPGMVDAKNIPANSGMMDMAVTFLNSFSKALRSLVIYPERALEELNSDWTVSQEIADVLMREHKIPFRVGHHFASAIVSYAKKNGIKPLDFPYDQAKRIYREAVGCTEKEFPMSQEEFRKTQDPVAAIAHRATTGGPQPAELARMLSLSRQRLAEQKAWNEEKTAWIDRALASLDSDFKKLL